MIMITFLKKYPTKKDTIILWEISISTQKLKKNQQAVSSNLFEPTIWVLLTNTNVSTGKKETGENCIDHVETNRILTNENNHILPCDITDQQLLSHVTSLVPVPSKNIPSFSGLGIFRKFRMMIQSANFCTK